jgi:hypothetical protein
MLTVEELMKPRFEVIADYPNNPYEINDVLTKIDGIQIYSNGRRGMSITDLESFPNLFREMEWWEIRPEQDMPKYIKWVDDYGDHEVLKVEEWESGVAILDKSRRSIATMCRNLFPATEAEYIAQLEQQKIAP